MEWTFAIWVVCLSVCQCRPHSAVNAMSGEVQSPQYPQPYPPNLLNHWNLWAPKGFQVHLQLTHLDIKHSRGCSLDSLTIKRDNKVIRKLCGQKNITELSAKPIVSEGDTLRLIFQTSDFNPGSNQHTGFSAAYKNLDVDECLKVNQKNGSEPLCSQICVNTLGSYYCSCYSGYKLQADQRTCLLSCNDYISNKHEGHLSSPRFPHPSPPNLYCTYVISVEDQFTIILNFTDFHVYDEDSVGGPTCPHHWLQVTIPDKMPTTLCGERNPGVIATDSKVVRLDYKTDDQRLSRGWSLNYIASVSKCEEPKPLLNGGMTLLSGTPYQRGSVIQYHCNEPFYTFAGGENVTFTCEADRMWKTKHQNVSLKCTPVCGKPTAIISDYARILGGREAPPNTIPWQVLLSIGGLRVGGMVIAGHWVMTAAHNLVGGRGASNKTVQVHVGHTNLKALLKSPVLAASVYIHPEYNNSDGLNYDNDIALIRLQEPITFGSGVMPICFGMNPQYTPGSLGLVSGFGIMDIYPPRVPKSLKYVYLPIVDQETCLQSLDDLRKSGRNVPRLTDNMFCVGLPEGGRSSCLGDDGGPFAQQEDDAFWATGIDSWGVDCGKPGTYRVYTRVTNYLDWIIQMTTEFYKNSFNILQDSL